MLKYSRRLLGFLLMVALLWSMMPVQAFANLLAEAPTEEAVEATAVVEGGDIVAELPDSRNAYTKQFLLDNGNTMAVQYAIPVHYQDSDGTWVQYDNRMTETTAADSTPEYRVIQSDKAIRLSKKASEKKLVTIEKDGHQISWGFSGIHKVDVSFVEEDTSYEGNEAYLTLEGIIQEARYNNVFQNVDLQYFILPTGVKENIILKNANAQNEFEMEYKFHQLTATQTDSRNITLSDKDGNTVYTITAPAMCDANGVWSNALTLTIVEAKQNKLTVKLTADLQWLLEDERSFPVTVDPSFNTEQTWGSVDSTTIVSGHPNTAYGPNSGNYIGSLYVGYEPNSSFRKTRSLVRLNTLPQLSPGDVIVDAQLCLLQQASNKTIQVNVHQATADWAMKTATWNTMNANYDPTVEDYDMTTYGTSKVYNSWNVTDLVRKWYDGTAENHGVMLIAPTETATSMSRVIYYASTYPGNVTVRPVFQITYRNHNGLEGYWDYTASSAGRAGTGYVNSYTGNLVWTKADMGFGGNRGPVSISHIYNTNDAQENLFGMGYGWRTNYNQRVYVWAKDSDFYIWEDADGTDHYFAKQSDGTYKDEDGLELTLTDSGSGTEKYIIQDKNGNKTYFDTNGRLTKISNNQETVSSITVSYTASDSLLISTVTDGVGRVYQYTYNTDNLLSRMAYKGSGSTELFHITYGYTSGMLTSVTDKDGETVTYAYNTDYHYLTAVSDIDDYKITYEYTQFAQGKPSRVTKVQEFDGTASGGVLTIAYGRNKTTFTDKLGNVQILQFNNCGNTVSVQDGEGRAQFAQYAQDTDSSAKGNQLTLSSKLQNTVVNLLDNSSFEDASCAWFEENEETSFTLSTTQAYLGSQSLTIPSGEGATRNYLSLEAGETYTLSVFVKGDSSVQLEIQHQAGILITGESISVTSEWTRVQLSCTNPNSTALPVIPIIRNTGTGTIYADCVQLEKAPTASRYNLIQNGDFQADGQWTATNSETADGRTTVTAPAPKLDSNVYAIVGNRSTQKNICQTVSVSGEAGDSFVLGGWAMGNAVPIKETRAYGLYAIFHYTDGTTSDPMQAAFNPDTNGWQYTAVAIVAEQAYSSISVYACYDYGINTVCFDGIQLFKEVFGTSYAYDDEGNVEQVTNIQGKKTQNTYSNDNDLLCTILPDGTTFAYQYDDYHNVISARSNEGVIYTFEYDTYGNNTAISVTQDGIKLITTADYTDDGNCLESVTDTSGSITRYSYNANTNMLEWVQYPEDTEATRTTYSYDEMHRAISVIVNTDTSKTMSAQYEYTDDYLTSIFTPSTTYTFNYGNFGLRTNLKIGDQSLATYEYDTYNRLKKLAYGNLDMVEYTYDEQGRVVLERFEDNSTIAYTYDSTGALATVVDSKTGITTTYYYDLIDRLVMYEEKCTGFSHSVEYLYNDKNKLQTLAETIDGVITVYNYVYDADDRVISVSIGNGEDVVSTVTYSYDALGRMSQQVLQHRNEVIATKSSVFSNISDTTTSLRLESYNGWTYTYDLNGNITSISDGTNCTTYEYDSIGQLLRENNEALAKTWIWTYDNAGNIQTCKEYNYTLLEDPSHLNHTTIEYSYNKEGAWGDLLTTYGNIEIEYDAIGNPTKFGDWELDWQHGRQLAALETEDGARWEFLYNADGMRVRRATGDVNYYYVYNGSQLARLKADSNTLYFTYDATGTPLTVSLNGTVYYYSVNLQGDIVAILDNTGAAVVNYTYDAWGNPGSVTGSLATTLGFLNPLRYRGYIYDAETGLYYLQSRYYHPQTGRFINADGMIASGHGINNNLFTYCKNDPVNYVDLDGYSSVWWILLQIRQMGYIHTCVELDILANNPGTESELWLRKDGQLIGRADIMYGNVVWEIKHAGSHLATAILRGEQAISQAKGYIGATTVRLKRGVAGLGPAGMFSGQFTVAIFDHAYCVTYDTPADGVILYYIEEIEYEKEYSYDYVYVPNEQKQVVPEYSYSPAPQYSFNRGSMQKNYYMALGGAIGGAMIACCLSIAPYCALVRTNR